MIDHHSEMIWIVMLQFHASVLCNVCYARMYHVMYAMYAMYVCTT